MDDPGAVARVGNDRGGGRRDPGRRRSCARYRARALWWPATVPLTGGWLTCLWPESQPTQCVHIGAGEGMLRPPSDPRRLAPLP